MSEPVSKKQRTRSKNFSIQEVEILKNEIKAQIHIINAKHCNGVSGVSKKLQDTIWADIALKVNSVGIAFRSVAELKEKWRNLTKKAKSEVTEHNKYMSRTGGGPPPSICFSDKIIADIAELHEGSPAFHGIEGALDAESIIFTFDDLQKDDNSFKGIPDCSGDHCSDENNNDTSTISQQKSMSENRHISNAKDSSATSTTVRQDSSQTRDKSTKDNTTSSAAVSQLPASGTLKPHDSTKDNATENTVKSKHSMQANSQKKEKTLKELQIEFYMAAIENQKQKYILHKEQQELCLKQTATLEKINTAIDFFVDKFTTK